ncbi:alcohol dehydrogenase [Kineobactrum sediminis]|uniref:Alcohol dehydrogenase n=2 Tax=Kineobactrum sediminis TaxID=1905677 RepID=A0A2N5XYS0_9GAMM|nr:alcohol dehydrogenase [Kineobactrum sediminis]
MPAPGDEEVLIKVHAASVNPLDWHYMRGTPYFIRLFSGIGAPSDPRMGVDFAGTVEAVGSKVTRLKPGDRVFGGRSGAFAEYLLTPEDRAIALIPDTVSFEDAAAVPIAAVTAMQALRDHGQLRPGQKILVNGASGGVGTYTVQIAKAMGAKVTGVSSGRNLELVRSLGADHVINYKEENYTDSGEQYDLIVDMVGNHSPLDNSAMLTPNGRLVIVGGAKGDWIAPMIGPIKAALYNNFVDQELATFTATLRRDDLEAVAKLMSEGKVRSVIDRRYSLAQVPEAIAYSETGRARGKIIINVE